MIEKQIKSEDDLKAFAEDFAKSLKGDEIITLVGQLGAGKTTFSKYFVKYFIADAEVSSPTFPILNEYSNNEIKIAHYDLYRIKDSEELIELGFQDSLNRGLTLVEWPEKAINYLPNEFIIIKIELNEDGSRTLKLKYEK